MKLLARRVGTGMHTLDRLVVLRILVVEALQARDVFRPELERPIGTRLEQRRHCAARLHRRQAQHHAALVRSIIDPF
jgi:hypothetical protein